MDYKDRFKVEAKELKDRIYKLSVMLEKYRNGKLDFKPICPYNILYTQFIHMKNYYEILKIRAVKEGIEID